MFRKLISHIYSHHSDDPSELSFCIKDDSNDISSSTSISSGKSIVVPVELLETGDTSSCTSFLFLVVAVECSDLDTDEQGPGWPDEPSDADIPVLSGGNEIKNY